MKNQTAPLTFALGIMLVIAVIIYNAIVYGTACYI